VDKNIDFSFYGAQLTVSQAAGDLNFSSIDPHSIIRGQCHVPHRCGLARMENVNHLLTDVQSSSARLTNSRAPDEISCAGNENTDSGKTGTGAFTSALACGALLVRIKYERRSSSRTHELQAKLRRWSVCVALMN